MKGLIKFIGINKIICKHEYRMHTWSYVKCPKCQNVKHDPELANFLINKWTNKWVSGMEKAGFSDEQIRKEYRDFKEP